MKKPSLAGKAISYAVARYFENKRPSKTPFVIAGLVFTLLIIIAIFTVRAERRISTTDLSAAPAKIGTFSRPKSDGDILKNARRQEQDGAVIPAGLSVAPGGGIATDVRLQDVDNNGTKDLVVVGPKLTDGVATVTGYVWNGTLFVYDANLTWALSTSHSLFPEP